MNHWEHSRTRRQLLRDAGCGFGLLALANLLSDSARGTTRDAAQSVTQPVANSLIARPTHFRPSAKRVIWIFTNGGPSQVDTWDYKPALAKWHGKSMTEFDSEFPNTTGFFKNSVGKLMKSPFKFRPHGECGKMVSSIFPELAQHVDKMAFIHSGYSESNNHSTALLKMNCGLPRMGYPCLGSWVSYGLGSESRNLPAFVVMSDPKGRGLPKGHAGNWSAGYLPSVYQATHLKPTGPPIENLQRVPGLTEASQRRQLDFLRSMNQRHAELQGPEPELDARIESFELAFRMQSAAPDAVNIDAEPAHVQQLYGIGDARCEHFGRQCLVARRMVERGVRFVQIYSGGNANERSWDGHIDIQGNHAQFAGETDRPVAGLLADLEQRGMLHDTLVIWCGEFGRLPVAQTFGKPGRDHNPHCFSAWLAGGGIKGGTSYGESDEIGYKAAVDRVHANDLHATILHLLGIDHTRLTYRHNGRDFRLTDVAGQAIHQIIA